jgi:hypothetical protein
VQVRREVRADGPLPVSIVAQAQSAGRLDGEPPAPEVGSGMGSDVCLLVPIVVDRTRTESRGLFEPRQTVCV